MQLTTKTAQRLEEIEDMLNHLPFWADADEKILNAEKQGVINFKNELKEKNIKVTRNELGNMEYRNWVDKLIYEIESVENNTLPKYPKKAMVIK